MTAVYAFSSAEKLNFLMLAHFGCIYVSKCCVMSIATGNGNITYFTDLAVTAVAFFTVEAPIPIGAFYAILIGRFAQAASIIAYDFGFFSEGGSHAQNHYQSQYQRENSLSHCLSFILSV